MQDNPYEAPSVNEWPTEATGPVLNFAGFSRAMFRWCLICGVCAIPSFSLGMFLGSDLTRVSAMVAGTVCFGVIYGAVDVLHGRKIANSNSRLSKALRIGFITRMGVSIIFPIGMLIDLFPGMVSLAAVQFLFGQSLMTFEPIELPPTPAVVFASVFVATLIQGLFMNVILAAYVAVLYRLTRAPPARVSREDSVGERSLHRR